MFTDRCAEHSIVVGYAAKMNENVRRVQTLVYTIKSKLTLIKMFGILSAEERRA